MKTYQPKGDEKIPKSVPDLVSGVETPSIKISKVVEHKDGTASYTFEYDEKLEDLVKKHLKLNKKPTKKQICKVILDAVKETANRKDKNL